MTSHAQVPLIAEASTPERVNGRLLRRPMEDWEVIFRTGPIDDIDVGAIASELEPDHCGSAPPRTPGRTISR